MATSSVEYISEEECEGLWVGNDCKEDPICLSNPMNPYWNANCNTFIEENIIINNPKSIINVLGQGVRYDKSSLKIYLYKDGSFEIIVFLLDEIKEIENTGLKIFKIKID